MGSNNKRKIIEEVRKLFEQKDTILLCNEYINARTKMEFICNKHKELGIQKEVIIDA